MPIKQVKDLIPYHKSLKELWDREEFQPVKELLTAWKNEAITNVLNLQADGDEKHTIAQLAKYQSQATLAYQLLVLPDVIKQVENSADLRGEAKAKFVNAQEGGAI